MKQGIALVLAVLMMSGSLGCGGPEERKAKYRLHAQEYFQQGNFPKARVAIRNVLKIDPKDVEAYFLYAQVEEKERNWRNAVAGYQQVVELSPDHDRAQMKLAKYYLEARALEQVTKITDRVLSKTPGHVPAQALQIAVMAVSGKLNEALGQAERLIATAPAETDAVLLMASLYAANQRGEDALPLLRRALETQPQNLEFLDTLATILIKQGQMEEAGSTLQRIIALEPTIMNHRLRHVAFYDQQQQYDKAESVLKEAIRLDPDNETQRLTLVEYVAKRRGLEQAESALLDALRTPGQSREQIDSWSAALFDLYRATGQQNRFDTVAIDFAERFGRSAPAWFSMPELLGITSGNTIVRTIPSRLEDEPVWRSPARFNTASVDELELALANAPSPWFLDWGPMLDMDVAAAEPLAALVGQWTARPVHLRFRNPDSLERVLRAGTPAGNKSVSQAAWRLRMDALRIMGRQDDFELVALEYCVTFEVSPPAWQDVRCGYVQEPSAGSQDTGSAASRSGNPEDDADTVPEALESHALTVPMGLDSTTAAVVELAGEILGEATDALSRLERARQGGERLVISCATLIRVDFSAAGSILNWVATRQSEGCQVQFREVHRLVAAFFHVIGINEHARVVLRSN